MDKPQAVLIESPKVQRPRPMPRLRLLIERERGYRVFLRNLGDLFWTPEVPPLLLTSQPGHFWNDVFVPTGLPWTSFFESLLWHSLLVVLFVWAQSRVWQPVKTFSGKEALRGSITYYPPSEYFRATESRAPTPKPRSRSHRTSPVEARQEAMHVTAEQKSALVTPPDIKQATASLPNLESSHEVPPMVPFSATGETRRGSLTGASGVVGPPAELERAATRRAALPEAGAVAPAPELGGVSRARALRSANAGGLHVVPPPPSVESSGESGRVRASLPGPGQAVVPPPPSVQSGSNGERGGRLSGMVGSGTNVVPPPPSIHGAGNAAGEGRLGLLATTGSEVVPPAPGISAAGSSARSGRPNSLSGAGPNVVPPPPSVQGGGGATRQAGLGSLGNGGSRVVPPPPSVESAGNGLGTGSAGGLSGTGPNVVPPPPSVQGAGDGAGGRLSSMGGGTQVVPPPPAVQTAGNGGLGGRGGSLGGSGTQIVPPPPSMDGSAMATGLGGVGSVSDPGSEGIAPAHSGGGSGLSGAGGSTGKALEPMALDNGGSPDTTGKAEDKSTIEELPLGLLGLVFTAEGSSYFSNFEVFVAKRKMGKGQLQLIKLVYEFLPYQKRLSEYDLNNLPARVIKLRVIPDPNCNESLGDIVQPSADPNRPSTQYPKLPPALLSADMNAILPCYRTTADDFRKAMGR